MVARLLCKEKVTSSTLVSSTVLGMKVRRHLVLQFFLFALLAEEHQAASTAPSFCFPSLLRPAPLRLALARALFFRCTH